MEDELTSFHRNRATMEKDVDRALAEGEALIARLKDSEEIAHLRTVLNQVSYFNNFERRISHRYSVCL